MLEKPLSLDGKRLCDAISKRKAKLSDFPFLNRLFGSTCNKDQKARVHLTTEEIVEAINAGIVAAIRDTIAESQDNSYKGK